MRNAIAIALTATTLCACGAPIGPISGGHLQGTPKDWPTNWTFTDAQKYILLETNPKDPYSVTLWGVSLDDEFYIAAADPSSQWVNNLLQDPAVTVGVSGNLYIGVATVVNDRSLSQRVRQRYLTKYEIEAERFDEIGARGGMLFQITRH